MDIKLVVLDGESIERVGRILLVLIAKHRRARRALDAEVNERGAERPSVTAIAAERVARHAVLAFRATTMVDVAAKAAYVRTLLADGASGLDEKDWETLLRRFRS